MMKSLLVLPLVLVAVVSSAQFKPSKSDQVKLGQRAADDIRKHEKIVADSDQRVKLMRRVGAKLIGKLPDEEQKRWHFSFDIIDSKELNAFALPGGPIFFFTGLFDKFQTEDQLAGVLGHELTHIRKEHWASAYNDNQKRRLGLSLILILTKAGRTVSDIANIGDDLIFGLPYSRKHETEADDIGVDLVSASGYNPQGMADVFAMLKASSKGKPPELLATHPDDGKRIGRIQDKIKKMNRMFPAQKPLPWPAKTEIPKVLAALQPILLATYR